MPEINTKNLALIVALLTQLNVFMPEAKAVVGLIMDWLGKLYPDLTNAQRIALLKQHATANLELMDDWFAAHPDV